MKVFACWICYNNILSLPYSVDAVYDLIDELVIVDGSFKKERSTDGTWEYCQALKKISTKPVHLVESQTTSLFEKHNEHIAVTGNRDPDTMTWQIDSDEVYSERHALAVSQAIRSNKYNGIEVKLINIERFVEGRFYISRKTMSANTNQMRIYRMINGLTFKTKDGIFEWIVYDGNIDVQRPDNKLLVNNRVLRVDHYHCLATKEQAIARYTHYGSPNPEETEARIRGKSAAPDEITDHALAKKFISDTMTNKRYYESLRPFI